jgi:pyruvate dehydrogenase E1 component alpha subunit/2-oxoisovalerate dehydrogenase E1 component alpha subunit
VNGVLHARRVNGEREVVGVASVGDGATSTGAFHESLNQAAVEKLPLVVVIANNQYAYSTPTSRQFACRNLADRAVGYGIECQSIDGTDLATCLKAVARAVDSVRNGQGPQMVVGSLLRLCGHGEHDDASYVAAKLKSSPVGRDCLKVAEDEMQCRNWTTLDVIAGWRAEVIQKVEEAIATVQREAAPDPFKENWCALAAKHLSEGYE